MAENTTFQGTLDTAVLCRELSSISDWRSLGLNLGVRDYELDQIESSHPTEGCGRWKQETFSLWQRCTPSASWENVVKGLRQMRENKVAATIERKYIPRVSPKKVMSKSAGFAYQNLQAIKGKFAQFQRKVCNKLYKNEVDIDDFLLFVTALFTPGDCIPAPPTDFTKVFVAITHNGLWDYLHYSPLVQISREFCTSDLEVEGLIHQYEKDLRSYNAVTLIEDYIELELDACTDPPPAKRAKYDLRYLSPMEWKTDFVDHSMKHLDDVWKVFSTQYLLPLRPPTGLLERIRKGCVCIRWLVPSGLIPQLIKIAKFNTDFFQKHHILKVTVGNECIYEEETSKQVTSMQVSQTGQTWLSSLDLKEKFRRRTSASSNHGAVIFGSPSSPDSSQESKWYKRIACCQLESVRGTGQGVLVHLDQFSEALGLGENQQLGLLTNHHIIPCKDHVHGWKLHIGPEGNKKMFTLNDSMFTCCFSCCGPDGIWGAQEAHFQQSASDPPTPCPLRRDFSLLILAPSFASDLGSKLSQKDSPLLVFPPLHAPDKEEHCHMEFCILQRDLSGSIDAGQIELQSIAPPTDDSSLEREVNAYKDCCILRYPHNWVTKIGKGSSGSGIFCQDKGTGDIRLAGIHVSSEVDGGKMHYGLTVHAIVHSVAGGPTCGIIPALSLLKDASMHNCLAACWYENLRNCLNPEEINLDQFLKIVDFLLKAEPSIFTFTLGSPAVLPSLRMLAFLFRCFSKFESSKIFEMAERVLKTDGKLTLFQKVKELCNKVHNLLKEANQQNNTDVVEACFQCWYDMHEFGAPVYEVLYESAKISSLRIIRDDENHEECVAVHRIFGDIFMAYEAYKRGSEQRKYWREFQEQAQQFDAERVALETKAQQHALELQQEIQECMHQLAEERRRGEDLEQQCQDQKHQLAEERRRGEDLEQQCQDQKHQLAEERRRGKDLEQQCQDQKRQLAEERRRVEDLEQQCQDQKHQLAEERRRGEGLEQQCQEQMQQFAGERKKREELEQQLQEKEQELAIEKKRGEDSQQQLAQQYQYERETRDQEMLQTNLAFGQLQAEKQHLDEENEIQAITINDYEEQLQVLNQECESHLQEIQQLRVQLQPKGFRHRSSLPGTLPTTSLYATRKETPSFLVLDSEKAFWNRSMATLLKADIHGVRTKVGELYCKVQGGSGGGDWEQLLNYLSLKMDASKLETQPPGDIILQIVQFWEKKESVTVRRFCEVSKCIGIDSVAQVLQEAEHRDLGTTLCDSSLSSESHDI